MLNAQKPDHVSLNTLLNRLREGRYVIPDFQREFEWEPWDIRDLMRSIFLDYYIGSLLLWKGRPDNFEALSCEGIYGFDETLRPEHIVLDGQQRLTAMYYAFVSPDKPLPNRANRYYYFLKVDRFMAEEYDEAFNYQWSKGWTQLLENREQQFAQHIFPLSVVGSGGWELPNWVQGYEKYWEERAKEAEELKDLPAERAAIMHAKNARDFGDQLRTLTEQYQISYIELDEELGLDKVCDIFTQINSKGVQLDTFDLINALLKPKGLQLKHMWREASPRLEFVDTDKMNVYILQVMSILKQSYCSPKYLYFLLPGTEKPIREKDGSRRKEILVQSTDEFSVLWSKGVEALERAIRLLRDPREFGAIASKYLPYVSILPAFAAIQSYVRSIDAQQRLDAQRKISHWYWASVFLNRYSGSVETTAARDFQDLKAWITDDNHEPSLIDEFKLRFRNIDLRSERRSSSSIYSGIFNLLVIQGARDWMSGHAPQHDDLDDHHIIPISKAQKVKAGERIHSILNRTPLTAESNRHVIGDQLPNAYLPKLIQKNGESAVRSTLESHFISPTAFDILLRDPFTPEDFDAFLAERQSTIVAAIEYLLIKERIDLSPDLRDLDERVEQVELKLRHLISEALEGEVNRLPPHVLKKVEDRLAGETKRKANFEIDSENPLGQRLQFSDLRELQDTINSKSLWPLFAEKFKSKEALATKFGQLAELRNGIRHSRAIDEITKKEGDAALLWFDRAIGDIS